MAKYSQVWSMADQGDKGVYMGIVSGSEEADRSARRADKSVLEPKIKRRFSRPPEKGTGTDNSDKQAQETHG